MKNDDLKTNLEPNLKTPKQHGMQKIERLISAFHVARPEKFFVFKLAKATWNAENNLSHKL